MNINLVFVVAFAVATASCSSPSVTNNGAAPQAGTALTSSPGAVATPTAAPTAVTPKNGDYPGKGTVTKINLKLGSVELNHEEIKDVMPAMQMEFYVADKKLLNRVKVGDKADFVLRYKDNTETIVDIKKAQ
ncbi:MAG: copper-binding protein [Acidobacteriota bacterium]